MASNIVIKVRDEKNTTFIIHFTDDEGNEVSKKDATTAVINEYVDDNLINSSIGFLD